MHPIFDRVGIAHVIDVYDISKLADPLYAAFALFQPRGIPREIELGLTPNTTVSRKVEKVLLLLP